MAASAFVHLTALAMVVVFAEVHPFSSVTAQPIAVDIVASDQVKPEPMPDKTQPSDALDLADALRGSRFYTAGRPAAGDSRRTTSADARLRSHNSRPCRRPIPLGNSRLHSHRHRGLFQHRPIFPRSLTFPSNTT